MGKILPYLFGNAVYPNWQHYSFIFWLMSRKKSCPRTWEARAMVSLLRCCFSNILCIFVRLQHIFSANHFTVRPCSSKTALIICPTWKSAIWRVYNRISWTSVWSGGSGIPFITTRKLTIYTREHSHFLGDKDEIFQISTSQRQAKTLFWLFMMSVCYCFIQSC